MTNELHLKTPAYNITRVGLDIQRATTLDEWRKYGEEIKAVEDAIQWVIGDWLAEGKSHYADNVIKEASTITGLKEQTLRNYKSVSEHFELYLRKYNLEYSLYPLVMPIKKLEEKNGKLQESEEYDMGRQQELLAKAEKEKLTVRELQTVVQEYKRNQKERIRLHNAPEKYDIIYADPPWQYDNTGFSQSAESIYPTMPTEEICSLSIPAYENAVLFLWATSPLLDQAFKVIKAWGFEYKTNMVWIKNRSPGLGWWLNTKHELLLIATRGENIHPEIKHDSIFYENVSDHSRKPLLVYPMIEEAYPNSKRIELFARTKREGWDSWGNEV